MAEKMNLAQKLIEVRKSIPYLEKENENKAQGFNYVSDSQVAHAIRAKMDEMGIIIWPSCRKVAVIPNTKGTQLITEIAQTFVIEDAATGETRTCKWYSHGADSSDKGPAKASTLGQKRWILKLFNVPQDKDDPDADPGNGNGGDRPPAEPATPGKATAKPPAKDGDYITPGFRTQLINKMAEASVDEEALMEKFGFTLDAVPKARYSGVVKWLENKIKKHAQDDGPPIGEEFNDDDIPF